MSKKRRTRKVRRPFVSPPARANEAGSAPPTCDRQVEVPLPGGRPSQVFRLRDSGSPNDLDLSIRTPDVQIHLSARKDPPRRGVGLSFKSVAKFFTILWALFSGGNPES